MSIMETPELAMLAGYGSQCRRRKHEEGAGRAGPGLIYGVSGVTSRGDGAGYESSRGGSLTVGGVADGSPRGST
jgi:hypothetical protein